MPTIGTPISLKEIIHGHWYLTKLVVRIGAADKYEGSLTLTRDTDSHDENHVWSARFVDDKWNVSGDGAFLSDGSQVRSPLSWPFSMDRRVNDGVRSFIAQWIARNKGMLKNRSHETEPLVKLTASRFGNGDGHSNGHTRENGAYSAPPPLRKAIAPVPASTPKPAPRQQDPLPEPLEASAPVPLPALAAPARPAAPKGIEIVEALVSEIAPFDGQPREEFPEDAIEDMGSSLKQEGQKQLITITPITNVPGKRWMLVDGENRYRAALLQGIHTLTAMVKRYANTDAQFWDSFTMNWNRRDHTPLESSRSIARAMQSGKTVAEIHRATGLVPSWIYRHLRLQKLAPELRKLMRLAVPKKERLRLGIALKLAFAPTHEEQIRIWNVAKLEKSWGLRALKVGQMVDSFVKANPANRHKRTPIDSARRLERIFRSHETDQAFVNGLSETELRSFMTSTREEMGLDELRKKVAREAAFWRSFDERLKKLA